MSPPLHRPAIPAPTGLNGVAVEVRFPPGRVASRGGPISGRCVFVRTGPAAGTVWPLTASALALYGQLTRHGPRALCHVETP